MERESNAQKARRLLSERGQLCFCMQPVPEPGTNCGTIMGSGYTVSYSGTRCARCKKLIAATVR